MIMIRKVFSVLIIIMILGCAHAALGQGQPKADISQHTVLLGSAVLGATLGTVATEFLDFSLLWADYCRRVLPGQELIKRLEERYTWEHFTGLMLGPPTGASMGIIVVSQFYGLEGDIGLSFVGGFTGVLAGLGLGCTLLQTTQQPALEFVATVLPIGMVALGAVVSYDAQSRSRPHTYHHPASFLPSMSVTLWSLRF